MNNFKNRLTNVKIMEITLLSIELAPSIGLRIIQQVLLDSGHEAKLIHIPMQRTDQEYIDNVANELKRLCKDDGLIGISCMANTFISGSKLIKSLKRYLNIPIIMGGMHPTFRPEECLEYADYICLLEGEYPMLQLVERLEKGERTDNIRNIWLKKDNKIIRNKIREPIMDLNSLPIPCFDFKYLYVWHKNKILNLEKNPEAVRMFFIFFYNIISSKGCPFNCNYCGNNALCNISPKSRIIRKRSHEHILQELRLAKKRLGYFTLCFSDDEFVSRSLDDLKTFFEKYKKEINLPFYCAGAPTSITEDKIKVLIDSGMRRLQIGIQSINEQVNKNVYGRPITKKQIINMLEIITKYRYKFTVVFDVILDNPWEKDETRIETLKFLFTLKKPYQIWLYSIVFYPGTEFYKRAKKEGLIKNEINEVYDKSFLALQNSSINSLYLLFIKYGFPKSLINLLLFLRKFGPIESLLQRSTYFLLHLQFYLEGFKNSLIRRDINLFFEYLLAPARFITVKLEGKKRTNV